MVRRRIPGRAARGRGQARGEEKVSRVRCAPWLDGLGLQQQDRPPVVPILAIACERLAAALALLASCSGPGVEPDRQENSATTSCAREAAALEGVLTEFLAAQEIPGGIFGLRLADGRTLAVPAGFSDVESGRRMQADDLLHAGSSGKTFFAALILSLSAEGKLGSTTTSSATSATRLVRAPAQREGPQRAHAAAAPQRDRPVRRRVHGQPRARSGRAP
ncbi:MAG: hypothetical protein EXS08_13010 [Planctomycetes bacterium]|nr:hypothetical protein [Planctomycetota bacterium]